MAESNIDGLFGSECLDDLGAHLFFRVCEPAVDRVHHDRDEDFALVLPQESFDEFVWNTGEAEGVDERERWRDLLWEPCVKLFPQNLVLCCGVRLYRPIGVLWDCHDFIKTNTMVLVARTIMATNSHIKWTDATWNPVTGCDQISPGCRHCYAERLSHRLQAMGNRNYANGFAVTLHPHMLEHPLHWKTPKHIFVNSMSDLFHEQVSLEYIQRVFRIMYMAPLPDPHQARRTTGGGKQGIALVLPHLDGRQC